MNNSKFSWLKIWVKSEKRKMMLQRDLQMMTSPIWIYQFSCHNTLEILIIINPTLKNYGQETSSKLALNLWNSLKLLSLNPKRKRTSLKMNHGSLLNLMAKTFSEKTLQKLCSKKVKRTKLRMKELLFSCTKTLSLELNKDLPLISDIIKELKLLNRNQQLELKVWVNLIVNLLQACMTFRLITLWSKGHTGMVR